MLLVVHQVWWTNREARSGAEETVRVLVEEWADSGEAGAGEDVPVGGPEDGQASAGAGAGAGAGASASASVGAGGGEGSRPGVEVPTRGGRPVGKVPRPSTSPRWDQAYAVIRIPRAGVVAPVAEGVGKRGVLDKGYVGHYPGTAQPGEAGNFALAGHRNTHGEPFRYVNRLEVGDEVVVETRGAVYTYVVSGGVAQTSARDVGVVAAVPRSAVKPGRGFSEPGYYLTLTTCTPEFTSRYRLVVWAKLARMAPRQGPGG
ncbi:class E sortase [Streptomyces sp. NBC_00237]|uniref:class E sortase n=1 Tax=Streptomyces sp. NBC_00237 TaxID=2975687 RepID=UPI00224D98BE|nr:class E sortase [Streptomyces sp. NBC_00237]MCX5200964.1 class E sortase [Streptomyces sp. NBC_00237]